MKSEEEARFVKDARQETKEHEHAQLNIEEGVRLTLEVGHRGEKEDLVMKAEETRMKYEAEKQVCLNAEEEDQIAEEARLKAEEQKRAQLNIEEEVLLAFASRRQEEEEEQI